VDLKLSLDTVSDTRGRGLRGSCQDAPAVALQRAHASRCSLHRPCNGLGDGLGGVADAQADDLGVWVLFLVRTAPPCNLRARHEVLGSSAAGTSTWNTAGGSVSSAVCARQRRGKGRTPLGRDSPPAASRSCHCAARRCTLHARTSLLTIHTCTHARRTSKARPARYLAASPARPRSASAPPCTLACWHSSMLSVTDWKRMV